MALNKREYITGKTIITAENLNEIQDSVIGLENNVTNIGNDINTLNSEIDGTKEDITSIEGNITTINNKITSIEGKSIVNVSSSIPENPKLGDLWFDTNENEIERVFNIDSTPTKDSEALITSGGVFTGLNNKIEMVKIWENASPSSGFAEQTLNIDLTNYTMLQINFKVQAEGTIYEVHNIEINSKINATALSSIAASSAYTVISSRAVTTTNDSIYFATGSRKATNSNTVTQDTIYMIPLTIYGIKGVK